MAPAVDRLEAEINRLYGRAAENPQRDSGNFSRRSRV
jgi:hypothetical protein